MIVTRFKPAKWAVACVLAGSALTMTAQASGPAKNDPAFKAAIQHSNFMPTLMQVVMQNKAALNLTAQQLNALQQYHKENSPEQREDMLDVVEYEQEAVKYALQGDLAKAQKAGQESIALRQTIFNQKFRCHMFMQSTLSAEQYAKLLELAAK
jgi:ABC-type transporter Mla subunit MlaD